MAQIPARGLDTRNIGWTVELRKDNIAWIDEDIDDEGVGAHTDAEVISGRIRLMVKMRSGEIAMHLEGVDAVFYVNGSTVLPVFTPAIQAILTNMQTDQDTRWVGHTSRLDKIHDALTGISDDVDFVADQLAPEGDAA